LLGTIYSVLHLDILKPTITNFVTRISRGPKFNTKLQYIVFELGLGSRSRSARGRIIWLEPFLFFL